MKALVTGAEGFAGQHLIKQLIENGEEVIATTLSGSLPYNREIKTYTLDIVNKEHAKRIFLKTKPEVVFHLAAISSVRLNNLEQIDKVNVIGTKNILDSAKLVKAKSIVIGSAQEYGIPQYLPINEDHPLNPINPYGKSKVIAEKMATDYFKKGLPVVIIRSFNHIGPGQAEGFVCSDFAKQIVQIENDEKTEIIVGDLSIKRDFTDVRDVVKAYVLAAEKAELGKPYNICSGKVYEIRTILDKLIELANIKTKIKPQKKKFRKADIPVLQGDNSLFKERTGWKPEISIERSLLDILDYCRSHT